MADTISITTIATNISNLTITVTKPDGTSGNLAIKDISALPEAVHPQDCPMLAPRPDNFLSGFALSHECFGGDAGLKDVRYTLNYMLYYAELMIMV